MKNYLDLIQQIMDEGICKSNRTGVDTLSIFGTRLEFDLEDGFPLLTTKKMFLRGVVEELLFFIRGDTQTKKLEEKKVNIWKPNTTREFLDGRGLQYPEGEMGPGYGWQWRNYGGSYDDVVWTDGDGRVKDRTIDKDWDGVDQLRMAVETLRQNKHCRRNIVTAWNPEQLPEMALPPCHLLFQFWVDNRDRLCCQWYQRSVDVPLGLPFNIASYALLTNLIAEITNLRVGKLIFVGGDTHIYENQLEGCYEQLRREPKPLPRLKLKNKTVKTLEDIEKLEFDDFELVGYEHHPKIDFPFAT